MEALKTVSDSVPATDGEGLKKRARAWENAFRRVDLEIPMVEPSLRAGKEVGSGKKGRSSICL